MPYVDDPADVLPGGLLDASRFPSHLRPAFLHAARYLLRSPTLRAVLRRIAASQRLVFLEYHAAHTKFLHHNATNLRIQWNPHLGLRDCTGWLTPAMLLGHELGHAQFCNEQRCAMLACERPQGFMTERFGVEEAHVIATVERPVAAELNAVRRSRGLLPLETAERHQHQLGAMVEVAGPLCSDPACA